MDESQIVAGLNSLAENLEAMVAELEERQAAELDAERPKLHVVPRMEEADDDA